MKEAQEIKEAIDYIISRGFYHSPIAKACKKLSIEADQLEPKTLKDFINKHSSKEMAEVWYKHYEARRRAQLVIIGKYLIEHKLLPMSFIQTNLKRSHSSSITYRAVNSPSLNKDEINQNLEFIKKNIIKKLKVEKNLKKLKIEQEKRKQSFEEKLYVKSCRSDRKMFPTKQIQFEKHERRIKEILEKKYKDLDFHEKNALNCMYTQRENSKSQSFYLQSPYKKSSKQMLKKLPDDNIDQKLKNINTRLNKSAERAKQALTKKAHSGYLFYNQSRKVKIAKEEIDFENEKKNLQKISKLQKDLIETNVIKSQKRKEEFIKSEQQRIARNHKIQEEKIICENLRLEKIRSEKEKNLEKKAAEKEKMRKESAEKSFNFHNSKNYQRKKDQELNIIDEDFMDSDSFR